MNPFKTFAFVFLFIGSTLTSCITGITGNGNVVTESRPVSSFDKIEISGAYEVVLRQGDKEELDIEADENLLDIIETKVSGNTLSISNQKRIGKAKAMRLYITFTELERIDVAGAVEMRGNTKIETEQLTIEVSGASEINLDIEARKLTMDLSGGNEIHLKGKVDDVQLEISGAGEVSALELETKQFAIEINGAGEAEVNVSEELDVDISGAGDVRYKGSPNVAKSVSGAGSVKPV